MFVILFYSADSCFTPLIFCGASALYVFFFMFLQRIAFGYLEHQNSRRCSLQQPSDINPLDICCKSSRLLNVMESLSYVTTSCSKFVVVRLQKDLVPFLTASILLILGTFSNERSSIIHPCKRVNILVQRMTSSNLHLLETVLEVSTYH